MGGPISRTLFGRNVVLGTTTLPVVTLEPASERSWRRVAALAPQLLTAKLLAALLFAAVAMPTSGAPAETIQGGEIRGVIHIKKRLTKRPVAPVAVAYHRGVAVQPPVADEDFHQAEIDRVAVYLESEQRLPSKTVTATLKQKDRRFVEDTLVIPVGSSVSFPNLDPIFHNVFSLSRAKSFDLGNYPENETRTVTFPKAGVVRVFCHLHPNMSSTIVVTPNRWAVKPESNGTYRLVDVPPGEHTLVVWHKSAGFFRERVRVEPGKTLEVSFDIPVGVAPQGK